MNNLRGSGLAHVGMELFALAACIFKQGPTESELIYILTHQASAFLLPRVFLASLILSCAPLAVASTSSRAFVSSSPHRKSVKWSEGQAAALWRWVRHDGLGHGGNGRHRLLSHGHEVLQARKRALKVLERRLYKI